MPVDKKKRSSYQSQWRKEHTVMIAVRFNTEYDADVIGRLKEASSMADYIRQLVRADIGKNAQDQD